MLKKKKASPLLVTHPPGGECSVERRAFRLTTEEMLLACFKQIENLPCSFKYIIKEKLSCIFCMLNNVSQIHAFLLAVIFPFVKGSWMENTTRLTEMCVYCAAL